MTQIPDDAAAELFGQIARAERLAATIPSRDQLARLYHWQHLATRATRSTKSEKRVYELLTAAYGESLGQHLAYKLLKTEDGNVTGWLLTLDTENAATFWNSPDLNL